VSKTLTGLSEQVDTFKNLRESGASTISVLKGMEESITSLKKEITELSTMGGDAYKITGVIQPGAISQLDTYFNMLKDGRMEAEDF
jgi:hypothetical protein